MVTPIPLPNLAKVSPRYHFQWYFVAHALANKLSILNVGCASDPLGFGDQVTHFDYDDWSARHKWFIQGDAHNLSNIVGPRGVDVIVCGDVLEHAYDPIRMVREFCLASTTWVVLTVFKEWRLPKVGLGQVDEGYQRSIEDNKALGYETPEAYQEKIYPERKDGGVLPHLCHINQFDTALLQDVITKATEGLNWQVAQVLLVSEPTLHEGHPLENYLLILENLDTTEKYSMLTHAEVEDLLGAFKS